MQGQYNVWYFGERINREKLKSLRAEYGKEIVATVARQFLVDDEKEEMTTNDIKGKHYGNLE